jgi:ribosomal protein L18E
LKFTDVSELLAASIIKAIALMMEAANTSETLINVYQITRRNNPGDSHLHNI